MMAVRAVAAAVLDFLGARGAHYCMAPIRSSTSTPWPRGLTPDSAYLSLPRFCVMKVERWMQIFFLPSCSFSCSTP